jgi:hypothetical protein
VSSLKCPVSAIRLESRAAVERGEPPSYAGITRVIARVLARSERAIHARLASG